MANNYLKRRKRLGLTREQLAAAAGVSLSTIVRFETYGDRDGSNLARNAIQAALDRLESKGEVVR